MFVNCPVTVENTPEVDDVVNVPEIFPLEFDVIVTLPDVPV